MRASPPPGSIAMTIATGLKSRFRPAAGNDTRSPDGVCKRIGVLRRFGCRNSGIVSLASGPKREHVADGRNDSECSHDPLCGRITQSERHPDQAIPVRSYLAILWAVADAGVVSGSMSGATIEPKKRISCDSALDNRTACQWSVSTAAGYCDIQAAESVLLDKVFAAFTTFSEFPTAASFSSR